MRSTQLYAYSSLALLTGISAALAQVQTEPALFSANLAPGTETAHAEFVVKNRFATPAKITEVKTSCDCLAVSLSKREIPAGGQINVAVDIDLKDRPLPQEKRVDLTLESVNQKSVTLPILLAQATTPAVDSDAKLYRTRNEENLKASRLVKTIKPTVTGLDFDYNHFIMDGQSLSVGADSKAALSLSPVPGTFMIGDRDNYDLNRKPEFTPLISREVATNEPPVIGAARYFSQLYTKDTGKTDRNIVASSVGVSGRSVEELSKGAPKDYYGRLVGSVAAGKTAAAAQGKTYGVAALLWMQGETNYNNATYDNTKDGYKAKLLQLRQDFLTDAIQGTLQQNKLPAFVSYQTSGAYTNDRDDIAVGMAQWEISKEVPGCYLATPSYPFIDYGGHLTANGYRWIGAQFGKVLNKIIVQRQDWKPLAPRNVTRDGRTVAIDFNVPEPPLKFDSPWVGRKAGNWKDKGFMLVDAEGRVPLKSVRIVLDTIVEIVAARDLTGEVSVLYASKKGYDGNGMLRDSDPTLAEDVYQFLPESKNLPDEDIADLNGKPYPLANWSIAFNLKVPQ